MTRTHEFRPIEILLIEDNPGDVRLTQEALRECRVNNRMSVAQDGVEAMRFLRRESPHEQAPRPDLILLDLNLPRKDGWEVLAEIKADSDLRRIPVVILTSSNEQEDVKKGYNLHANSYLTKPVDLENFVRVMHAVDHFWLQVVVLPSE
jgi:chemotaxis family two-component system response regulator Rcp1